jgi:hypothetical protein
VDGRQSNPIEIAPRRMDVVIERRYFVAQVDAVGGNVS